MGWKIGGGAFDNMVDTVFGTNIGQVGLNDNGKVLCLWNRLSSPRLPQACVVTLDQTGALTRGTDIQVDDATWETYQSDIFLYEPNRVLAMGAEGSSLQAVILEVSGTTVTVQQNTRKSFTSQPRTAFNYTNKEGVCWGPNGSDKLTGFSVSGLTWTLGDDPILGYDPGAGMLGGENHDISYDIASDRYVFVWQRTISSVSGMYVGTCRITGGLIVDITGPDLLHTTTRSGKVSLFYHEQSGKHVLLYNVDNARIEAKLLTVSGAGAVTQSAAQVLVPSGVTYNLIGTLVAGENPVTKDIMLFYSKNGLDDKWQPGKIIGGELRLGGAEDPFPSSSVFCIGFSTITYESFHGFMCLGMERSSNAYLIPGTWTETQFIDLPAFQAQGGEFPPVDVDITLPAFAMYQGQVCELTIDGELPALDVVSFSMSFDIVPSLNGTLGALTGSMNGGYALFGDLAPLEGSMTLYNETTLRIDGTLAPLEGSMTGIVSVVGAIAGELGALQGVMYGGASIDGKLAALTGSGLADVPLTIGIRGYLPPLIGSMQAETPGRAFLDGDLAPLVPALGVLEAQLPALTGRMYMSVIEATTNIAYVMNKASGGITRYPDYNFSFAVRWQGKDYLASTDGLFEYDREEDVPVPIAAKFTLPPSDYGESGEKRVPRVYLQGELAGQMRAGIAYDGGIERTSRVEGNSGVDKWRAKLPRGLKGHHFAVAVENVDGADFEIEQVDALVQITGRKI